MKRRYWLLLIAVVVGLVLNASLQPVRAASPELTGIKNVTLWVNPEYDDPGLLVMFQGKIIGVTPPAQVRFLVPSSASLYSAGSKDAQGHYTGGPPNRISSSIPGWDEISYILATDTFRVEYYDGNIIVGQPDKKVSYDFRWLYPISDLSVLIQKPRTATNFSVEPKGSLGTDGEGFTIQSYNYQNLTTSNAVLHYDISYTKTDSSVSVNNPPLNSSRSVSSVNLILVLPVLLGVIAVVVALWKFKSFKNSKRPTKRAPGSGTVTASRGRQRGGGFCRNCGKAMRGSDKFCPYCGNRVN